MSFYRDLKDQRVERLARAICEVRGIDPDKLVKDSGYDDEPTIPAWWQYQDFAVNFIACTTATAHAIPKGSDRFRETRGGWIIDRVTGLCIARVAIEDNRLDISKRIMTAIIAALHAEFGPSSVAEKT